MEQKELKQIVEKWHISQEQLQIITGRGKDAVHSYLYRDRAITDEVAALVRYFDAKMAGLAQWIQEDGKFERNINLGNGNPSAWQSAWELEEEDIRSCLDAISNINATRGSGLLEDEEEDRIARAEETAAPAATDREYVALWVKVYGALVIG